MAHPRTSLDAIHSPKRPRPVQVPSPRTPRAVSPHPALQALKEVLPSMAQRTSLDAIRSPRRPRPVQVPSPRTPRAVSPHPALQAPDAQPARLVRRKQHIPIGAELNHAAPLGAAEMLELTCMSLLAALEPEGIFLSLDDSELQRRILTFTRFAVRLATEQQRFDADECLATAMIASACREGYVLCALAAVARRSAFFAQLVLACFASLCRLGLANVIADQPSVRSTVLDGLLSRQGDASLATFALPCAHAMSDAPIFLSALGTAASELIPILGRLHAVDDGEEAGHCIQSLLPKIKAAGAQASSRSAPPEVLRVGRMASGRSSGGAMGGRMSRWIARIRSGKPGTMRAGFVTI